MPAVPMLQSIDDHYSVFINGTVYTPYTLPAEWSTRRTASGMTFVRTVYGDNRPARESAAVVTTMLELAARKSDIAALLAGKPDEKQSEEEASCVAAMVEKHKEEIINARHNNFSYVRHGDRRTYRVELGRIHTFSDGTTIFMSSEEPAVDDPLTDETTAYCVDANIVIDEAFDNEPPPTDVVLMTYGGNHVYKHTTLEPKSPITLYSGHTCEIHSAVMMGGVLHTISTVNGTLCVNRSALMGVVMSDVIKGLSPHGKLHTDGSRLFVLQSGSLMLVHWPPNYGRHLIAIRADVPPHDHAAICGATLYCARGRHIHHVSYDDPRAPWAVTSLLHDVIGLVVVRGVVRAMCENGAIYNIVDGNGNTTAYHATHIVAAFWHEAAVHDARIFVKSVNGDTIVIELHTRSHTRAKFEWVGTPAITW
jgi:hypothetical protein